MIKKCALQQPFGANATPLYSGQGFRGHTGIDLACGYGTPTYAFKKGVVYKIIDDKRPANDGSGYWAVFIVAEDINGLYCEWQIGHLSKITCQVGDLVDPWTVIGEEGNHGSVYAGGTLITKAMQDAGDKRGAHVHWNKKLLKRQTFTERDTEGGTHLTMYGGTEYQDAEGNYYQVLDYKNGYNGSVDCQKDLDVAFELVNTHVNGPQDPQNVLTPEEAQTIQDGIAVIKEAAKYPALTNTLLSILKAMSDFLGTKKR